MFRIFASCLILLLSFQESMGQSLFDYSTGSQPEYESYSRQSVYVTLSDSTQIATDIFLPTEGPAQSAFPTIFIFTAYNRAVLVPEFGLMKRVGARLVGLGTGPDFDMAEIMSNVAFLLRHGYAFVVSDLRGAGASSGSQLPLMPRLGEDGKEMIDWISEQRWCDGNVGMMGPSYLGWIQYVTAAQQPDALQCIMPEVMGFDIYTSAFRPGGILAHRWIDRFDQTLMRLNRNWYDLKGNAIPSLPVWDEDGDGTIYDEWPEMDSLSQEEKRPPTYEDGKVRTQNRYYEYTLEHLDNVRVKTLADTAFRFWDADGPAEYKATGFSKVSPSMYLPKVWESGIPVYLVAGWFDGFAKGPLQYFASLGEDHPRYLFIAPRFHFGEIPRYYRQEFDYEGKYVEHLQQEQLRFFDRYLKGLENGLEDRPAVTYHTPYLGWQQSSAWPLQRQKVQSWWLGADGTLDTEKPPAGSLRYEVDFSVSSDYGRKAGNRWMMTMMGPGDLMHRTEIDKQCLVFESQPLAEPIEITGHPVVHLWVSANQPAGDVFVYLGDVAPDGTVSYMSEGMLRSGFRRQVEDDEMVFGAYDVLPELPWHGYRRADYLHPSLGREPVALSFDLMPISWFVRPGHRIRITLAGADAHNFELHPALCPDGDVKACLPTEYTIHTGNNYPSSLDLPVVTP